MHQDDTWQLFYPNGESIPGRGWSSALDNPRGEDDIIGIVVVFLYRVNSVGGVEFLWQRRSENVSFYPGDYDFSAGGHVNLGESLIEAAVREMQEEIGVDIGPQDLNFVTMYAHGINRFGWVYVVDWTGREENFVFNDGEVSEVKWVPYGEMEEFRKKYAKEPLKEDNFTFAALDSWLKLRGLVEGVIDKRDEAKNYAFIDGQNLQLGTTSADEPWCVDLKKFRIYLRDKYKVDAAYYYVGAYDPRHEGLYHVLQKSGYLVVLREHTSALTSKKKGNVDTDIVFSVMKKLVEKEDFDKVVLVSGDGDYWRMVDYLIKKERFEKLLVPGKKSVSSLYIRRIADSYMSFLDLPDIKKKILREEQEKAGSP